MESFQKQSLEEKQTNSVDIELGQIMTYVGSIHVLISHRLCVA